MEKFLMFLSVLYSSCRSIINLKVIVMHMFRVSTLLPISLLLSGVLVLPCYAQTISTLEIKGTIIDTQIVGGNITFSDGIFKDYFSFDEGDTSGLGHFPFPVTLFQDTTDPIEVPFMQLYPCVQPMCHPRNVFIFVMTGAGVPLYDGDLVKQSGIGFLGEYYVPADWEPPEVYWSLNANTASERFDLTLIHVPEPGALTLVLMMGLLGIACTRCRKTGRQNRMTLT